MRLCVFGEMCRRDIYWIDHWTVLSSDSDRDFDDNPGASQQRTCSAFIPLLEDGGTRIWEISWNFERKPLQARHQHKQ